MMNVKRFIMATFFVSGSIVSADLEGTRWEVHNGDVTVEFQNTHGIYQAVAVEISPNFTQGSLGDTIVRNIQFHQESGMLKEGTIRMGALSAKFSAILGNDSLLNVTIQKLFITKEYEWKRIFNEGTAK